MDYRTLTPEIERRLRERKLAEVETEHATLTLDLRLAAVAGIDNDNVAGARAQLDMLEAQHAALVAWLDSGDPCPSS